MDGFKGQTVCEGAAEGRIALYTREDVNTFSTTADQTDEMARFDCAKQLAMEQIDCLEACMRTAAGDAAAAIFSVHRMLLEDWDYCQQVCENIERGACAERAVIQAGRTCAEMFEQMDDPYLRERGADMMDISTRVAACLAGQEYPCRMDDEAAVIITEEFYPSEIAVWQRGISRALVSSGGSAYSHASILAKEIGAPALIGCSVPLKRLTGEELFGRVHAEKDSGILWLHTKSKL